MPIYTYRCKNCGIQFDQRQSFSDQTLTRCPECSEDSLHKVYQPVGIVFKGSGFYSTDNRSSSRIRSAEKDKSDDGDGETKASDKESKGSEAKSESGARSEGSAKGNKSGEKSSSPSSNKD